MNDSPAGWQSRKQLLARVLGLPLDQAIHIIEDELNPESEFYDEYIQQRSRLTSLKRLLC